MALGAVPTGWIHTWLKPLYLWLVTVKTAVDSVTAGNPAIEVDAVATSALAANTYANGTLGVGATLTGNANGAFATIDGVAAALNQTYLITAETAANCGAYKLTTLGTGGTPFVLTRMTAFDQSAEMKNGTVFGVRSGTVNANTTWKYTGIDSPTVGTTSLTFARDPGVVTTNTAQTISAIKTFSAAPVIGAGLTASGSVSNNLSGATGTFETPTSSANFFKLNQRISAAATALLVADPGNGGAIAVTSSGVCELTSVGAETRTLAIPTFVGQELTLHTDTYVGNIVITVASAFNVAANKIITMGAAKHATHLRGVTVGGTRAWALVAKDGASLS